MSEAPDLSTLSDEQLMALVRSGAPVQPTNAQTHQALPEAQAQAYRQLAAAGGIDPQAMPGSARFPRAQGAAADQSPPGDFYVDPQGRVLQAPNSQRSAVNLDGVRALARGVPVVGSWLDEADAATNAFLAPGVEPVMRKLEGIGIPTGYDARYRLDNAGDFGDRYQAALNLQRFKDASFDAAHPVQSGALQGTGAVAGTVAALPALAAGTNLLPAEAGLLPRMGMGAVEGATLGGAQGYGEGSGDLSDPSRLKSGTQGAMMGGGLGAAAPLALTGLGAAWKASGAKAVDALKGERSPVAPLSPDAEALATALRGPNASDLAIPPGLVPEGASVAPRDLAEIISTRSSVPAASVPASAEDDAYARIARAMARQRQTPQEVIDRVSALGPRGMIADSGSEMRNLTRDAVNRPSGAEDIARPALDQRQMGEFVNGEWVVRPSSTRIADSAAEGLGVGDKQYHGEMDSILAQRKAQAGPAYDAAYKAPPVELSALGEFSSSPVFIQAYDRARGISQKAFVKVPGVEGEAIMPLPAKVPTHLDWRTLDLMKQGLDDLIKEGKVQGIGANEQGAVKGYLSRFVDRLDALNPAYKSARDAFAGPTAMSEALESGRSFIREDAPDLTKTMAGLSDSEKQMYRLGAYQALKDKLGNADVTYDAARQAGLLKPNQLERFGAIFPSRQAFSKFVNDMSAEREMFQTRSTVFGNSTTAKQLAHMADNDESAMQTMARGAVDAKTGNIAGLISALGKVGGPAKMSEPTAEALASILTNMDQTALPNVLERLTRAQQAQELAKIVREGLGSGAQQAGAQMAQPSQ